MNKLLIIMLSFILIVLLIFYPKKLKGIIKRYKIIKKNKSLIKGSFYISKNNLVLTSLNKIENLKIKREVNYVLNQIKYNNFRPYYIKKVSINLDKAILVYEFSSKTTIKEIENQLNIFSVLNLFYTQYIVVYIKQSKNDEIEKILKENGYLVIDRNDKLANMYYSYNLNYPYKLLNEEGYSNIENEDNFVDFNSSIKYFCLKSHAVFIELGESVYNSLSIMKSKREIKIFNFVSKQIIELRYTLPLIKYFTIYKNNKLVLYLTFLGTNNNIIALNGQIITYSQFLFYKLNSKIYKDNLIKLKVESKYKKVDYYFNYIIPKIIISEYEKNFLFYSKFENFYNNMYIKKISIKSINFVYLDKKNCRKYFSYLLNFYGITFLEQGIRLSPKFDYKLYFKDNGILNEICINKSNVNNLRINGTSFYGSNIIPYYSLMQKNNICLFFC
jgi:hypothetical protein